MKESKERIRFIIEYISAYEEKIKLANKNGLFDEAHLFELFAQNICNLWYKKEFINLNAIKKNYPCVDLLSEDGSIYVQVSTQLDIFNKIKTTLRSLEETKNPKLENITTPVFFVLSNESEKDVKDLTGVKQIGKYPFTVEDNLISTSKVIQKARTDISFQKSLYELLKQDIEGIATISAKLLNIFDHSTNVGLHNIATSINGEYEIDRTDLISKIKNDDSQFKLVSGDAGSGKSAICKKVLQEEYRLFFIRADKLASCQSIDNIWGVDIGTAFKYLQGEKASVYIDALEYISNAGESIKELFQSLLYEIKKYPNITFLTSCRSCDVGAFVKLFGLFGIQQFIVENISNEELKELLIKYDVIKTMSVSGKYAALLQSPFYINIIVSNGINPADVSDVNAFRDYIWKECICLNGKAVEKGIPTQDVVSAIEKIVIERSKRFSTGINSEEIDASILSFLGSNNVVTENDNIVRLKYDIYEDICFERLFDKEFDSCRGNFPGFFECIQQLGSGTYRRYQIWIANKLLAKINRDKFLHALVFDDDISFEWQRNTIIGLIKSPFSKPFFEEQRDNLVEKGKLWEFIELTNCFGFEMAGIYTNELNSISLLRLNACGYGRLALIKIIYEKEIYKDIQQENKIVKICKDYACRSAHEDEIDECACKISSFYLDAYFESGLSDINRKVIEDISSKLEIIYSLPRKAEKWISVFWTNLRNCYIDDNKYSRVAEEIMSWTLEHVTLPLVDSQLDGLLEIAETMWLKDNKRDILRHDLYGDGISDDYLWGIRGQGINYNYKHRDAKEDVFLRLIYQRRLKEGLEWTLSLINKMALEYSLNNPDIVQDVVLFSSSDKTEKSFIGSGQMWFSGREEIMMPTLIGDLVYLLKESIVQVLHTFERDAELFNQIAKYIKSQIIENSNNIIPLTIIEDVGFEFANQLPGYAIELASSLELISWDVQLEAHNIMTPAKSILMEQVMMTVGIPSLERRYPIRKSDFQNLQDYMAWNQLTQDKDIKNICVDTLEYLYEKINPNDTHSLLQVQKMDMRNAKVRIIEDKYVSVEPNLSASTQKIVDENEIRNQPENEIVMALKRFIEQGQAVELTKLQKEIGQIEILMGSPEDTIKYENYYIVFLGIALNVDTLSKENRTEYVCKWLDHICNVFTHKASYAADLKISVVLFKQYGKDIGIDAKNKLKVFMLKCLLESSSNGQISLLRNLITDYLLSDAQAARAFFNTIICCAKDEWDHSCYNQRVFDENRGKINRCPIAYGRAKPDEIIEALGLKQYNSKFEEIVEKYLFNEECYEIEKTKFEELDLGYLFIAMNTGLRLSELSFYAFAKNAMPLFVKSMEESDSIMETYYQRLDFKKMIERELTDEKGSSELAIDLLFNTVDYNQFSAETIKMYISIFEHVGALYFDSYDKKDKRKALRECIESAETLIDKISVPFVKKGMERIMIFDFERFGNDWNKYKAQYSYDDKLFLCRLWDKYQLGHEQEVLMSIYQMNINELLPEVLPVVFKVIKSLANNDRIADETSRIIIKSLVLKTLLDYSNIVKADIELHEAYEGILNTLIKCNDESAAVILDEYRTH